MNNPSGRGRAAAAIAVSALMLALGAHAATSFGSHGSQVISTDADYALHYETLSSLGFATTAPVVCRIDEGTSGVTDDHYYLHWGTSCGASAAVGRGDIRLTSTSGGSAGSVVKTADTDKDKDFIDTNVGAFLANVGFLEVDGIPGYTEGDFIYFSVDGNIDAVNADIRLFGGSSNGISSTAGSIITTSDQADVLEAGDADGVFPDSKTLTKGGFDFRVVDVDGDGIFDEETDRLYLTPTSGAGNYLRLHDLIMSNGDGLTFGSKVLKGTAGYVYQLKAVDPILVTTDADVSSLNARHVFMHFADVDGTDNDVWMNDIVMKSGSGSFGARVTSTSAGHGETITGTQSSFASQLYWLDTNGDDKYSPDTDPVYLNRPTSLNGPSDTLALTAGDIRMTSAPAGGYAAGTVVSIGDTDLTSYGGLPGNDGVSGKWFVLLHDVDGAGIVELQSFNDGKVTGADGSWSLAVDGAYISTSSVVSNGDTRLKGTPFLGNTKLDCDGTGADHADCSTAVAAGDSKWKTSVSGGTWTKTAAVYYDTDNDGTVDAGEFRLYHPALAPGAVGGSDADISSTIYPPSDFGTSGAWIRADVNSASVTKAYYDANRDGTISTLDIRLYKPFSSTPGTNVNCPSTGSLDDDCGAELLTDSNVRVTGDDGTYHSGRSEYVYFSKDNMVNAGDFRFLAVGSLGAGTTVAAGNADTTRDAPSSVDEVYLSWCEGTCTTHPNLRLRVGDVSLLPSAGTRVVDNTAGLDVTLTPVGTSVAGPYDQAIMQFDLGDSGSVIDDGFYLSFGTAGTKVKTDDIRLVPANANGIKAAGTHVLSSDSTELGAPMTRPVNLFTSAVKYVDIDSDSAYSKGDGVYLDLDNNGLDTGDIRLTQVVAGSTTYAPGTFVVSGNSDIVSYSFASSQPTWTLYFFDQDRDGAIDDTDTVYVLPGAAIGGDSLDLLAVRIGGTGGSSSGGTGGGGGGGGSTTPPASPPASPPTSPPEQPPSQPDPAVPESTVETANLLIAESLKVVRRDGANHLTWDDVNGEAGYQVWKSDSPFDHVIDLPADSKAYKHDAGKAGTQYIVTTYYETADGTKTGYSTTVNADGLPDVPGAADVQAAKAKKETPGLPMVGILAALGAVAFLGRRRFQS